jgi:uncharacterized membrane protein
MALALVGAFVAGYLMLVQLRVFASAWDPFFGNGSDRVLHSTFSESLPVSDAGAGMVAYLVEIVLGFIGPRDRWRRLPWAALAFEAVLLGTAVVGLALVVIQGTVVHRFCTLCLTSTTISVLILALSRLREARAAALAVLHLHREGVMWIDAVLGRSGDTFLSLERERKVAEARALTAATATFGIGIVLMLAALTFYHYAGASMDAIWRDSFLGALLIVLGVAGCAAPMKAHKSALLVALAGIGLMVNALVFVHGGPGGRLALVWWMDLAAGALVFACSVIRLGNTGWARHIAHEEGPLAGSLR